MGAMIEYGQGCPLCGSMTTPLSTLHGNSMCLWCRQETLDTEYRLKTRLPYKAIRYLALSSDEHKLDKVRAIITTIR